MKIKWKIVLSISVLFTFFIFIISFFVDTSISNIVKDETTKKLTNYSKIGLTLLDHTYPGDWSLDGTNLYKGDTLMNDNEEVIDELAGNADILVTLFAGNTRIATTVKENGKRKIGTPAADEVTETVIKSDKSFQGPADVVGKKAETFYVPIHDKSGATIGMWFVGIYTKEIDNKIKESIRSVTILLIVFLIIGIIFTYLIGNALAVSINKVRQYIEKLEKGNFHFDFSEKLMKRKDEVGRITASFHQMQKQIFDMITSIKTESVNLENSTNILIQSTDEVYKDIENISATTEELSAGSEETAASTEEMNSTAIEIEREIESVTEKTNHGAIVASEIKARAEQLEAAALESKKTAIDVYDITNKQLRDSIDKTGAIEEIKSLSQTILSISAQTHLLALNASIESARAGEAGKGFAVVANEIKNLARNSKEAVSKIDQIINDVAKAVEAMVIDSKNLLEFVDTKVVKDYEVLVQTSEQYHDDADTIENMVSTIKGSTIQLYESIQYIRKAIEEVTTATSESSRGATDIAEKSSSIALKSNQVLEQTQKNKEIIDHLNGMIQFFKI